MRVCLHYFKYAKVYLDSITGGYICMMPQQTGGGPPPPSQNVYQILRISGVLFFLIVIGFFIVFPNLFHNTLIDICGVLGVLFAFLALFSDTTIAFREW